MNETLTVTLPTGMSRVNMLETIADANDYKPFKTKTEQLTVKSEAELQGMVYRIEQTDYDVEGNVISITVNVETKVPSMTKEQYGALVIGKTLVALFDSSVTANNNKLLDDIRADAQKKITKTKYDYTTANVS